MMDLLLTLSSFILSFVLSLIVIPPIIRVARAKHLFEPFEERKIHTKTVPPLGGVAIFIGFTISSIIATDGLSFYSLKYIIVAVIAMFFIGLKDDLLDISARKKLVVQIFATLILITMGNVRLSNLHGILGTSDIGIITSVVLSLFAMIVIINAFNLIDGIDGLASGLAIMAASFFGIWFFISGHIQFSILSFALVGSLAGFFLYNVYGNKNKLFMGDTGSLIIGIVISVLVVKFNEFNIVKSAPYAINAAPVVSFAIIIVPLIDTLRVMTIRIISGKSPFTADTNHIHHRLLQLFPKHLHVTLIIIATNILIIAVSLLFNFIGFNQNLQFFLILLIGIGLSIIPALILRMKSDKKIKLRELATNFSNTTL